MQIHRQSLYILRFSADVLCLYLAFLPAASFVYSQTDQTLDSGDYFLILSLILVWSFSARVTGLYDEFRSRNFSYELIVVIKNILIQFIAAVCILFLLRDIALSRTFVFLYSAIGLIAITIERFLLRRTLNWLRRHGRNLRQILIVGAGEVGRTFYETILLNPHFGYRLVGFLDDQMKPGLNGQYLGSIDSLDTVLSHNAVDDVIVALPNYAMERVGDVVRICANHTTRVKIIPDYFRFVSDKFEISVFGKFPVISVRKDRLDEPHWYILKRIFDGIFAFLLFVFILSWLIPIIALVVKLSSRGPVFFKQERWGRDNKKIKCYKFRSMVAESNDLDENGHYRQACPNDPRVTKIGKFLRKTNLDELPQFWNVLKGEMSVVGPRPHPIPLNLESKDVIQNYMQRHLVKPGITGWAQVNGFRGQTKDSDLMQKRVDHDIWYIENWSFWLDLQIIFLTVWQMLKWNTRGY
jgi:putative colanic acid biosynthesis UDP-glucose lipid carrier transferase